MCVSTALCCVSTALVVLVLHCLYEYCTVCVGVLHCVCELSCSLAHPLISASPGPVQVAEAFTSHNR